MQATVHKTEHKCCTTFNIIILSYTLYKSPKCLDDRDKKGPKADTTKWCSGSTDSTSPYSLWATAWSLFWIKPPRRNNPRNDGVYCVLKYLLRPVVVENIGLLGLLYLIKISNIDSPEEGQEEKEKVKPYRGIFRHISVVVNNLVDIKYTYNCSHPHACIGFEKEIDGYKSSMKKSHCISNNYTYQMWCQQR